MKKFILAAVAAMTFCGVFAQNRDWANFKRYAESNKELIAGDASKRKVVFMGNSITEGWANQHPEFFTENGYVGRGISGQTSYQFLVRFREDVIDLKPKVVVINAATNDVAENTHAYDEDHTMGNIISMVELAKANKIKVILTTTLPAESFGWAKHIKDGADKIAKLNARIEAYAKKNKIPYVDYYSHMVTDDGRRALKPEYTNDGVHPTRAGYEVMEAIVLPVIKKMVK